MAQAAPKPRDELLGLPKPLARGTRECLSIALIAAIAYLLLALASYDKNDPGWSFSGPVDYVSNHGGRVGAWLADVTLYLFGYLAYLFPVLVGAGGWMFLRDNHDNANVGWIYGAARSVGSVGFYAGGRVRAGDIAFQWPCAAFARGRHLGRSGWQRVSQCVQSPWELSFPDRNLLVRDHCYDRAVLALGHGSYRQVGDSVR